MDFSAERYMLNDQKYQTFNYFSSNPETSKGSACDRPTFPNISAAKYGLNINRTEINGHVNDSPIIDGKDADGSDICDGSLSPTSCSEYPGVKLFGDHTAEGVLKFADGNSDEIMEETSHIVKLEKMSTEDAVCAKQPTKFNTNTERKKTGNYYNCYL